MLVLLFVVAFSYQFVCQGNKHLVVLDLSFSGIGSDKAIEVVDSLKVG